MVKQSRLPVLRAPDGTVRIYRKIGALRDPAATERMCVAQEARAEKEAEILAAAVYWGKSLIFALAILVLVLMSFGMAGGNGDQQDIRDIIRAPTPKPEAPRLPAPADNVPVFH